MFVKLVTDFFELDLAHQNIVVGFTDKKKPFIEQF
jgi:hypothetical protein